MSLFRASIDKPLFEAALVRAKNAFQLPNIHLIYKTNHPLAVRYDPERQQHELHTTLHINFVHRLCSKTSLSIDDACFLALAHEAGHIELNQKCVDANSNPANSNDQLSAIGMALKGFKATRLTAECHKESAIEAYCDAKLAQAIYKHFPLQAQALLVAVTDIRREESNKPKRFGDDYQTSSVLETMLANGSATHPKEAAMSAYVFSIASMSAMDNAWLTLKRPLFEPVYQSVSELSHQMKNWRQSRKGSERAEPKHGQSPSNKP